MPTNLAPSNVIEYSALAAWMRREQRIRHRRAGAIGLALLLAAAVIGIGGAFVVIRMVGI